MARLYAACTHSNRMVLYMYNPPKQCLSTITIITLHACARRKLISSVAVVVVDVHIKSLDLEI